MPVFTSLVGLLLVGFSGAAFPAPSCSIDWDSEDQEGANSQTDLSLLQVSAKVRLHAADSGVAATSAEASPMALDGWLSMPHLSRSADEEERNKSRQKAWDKMTTSGNISHDVVPLPVSKSGNISFDGAPLPGMASLSNGNAHEQSVGSDKEDVSVERLEDEIAELRLANVRLRADLIAANELLNRTHSETDAGLASSGAEASKGKTASVASSEAEDGSVSEAAAVASSETEASSFTVFAPTDPSGSTVLKGGRNYSGDGAKTDNEQPLVKVSIAEGSGFSAAFTATFHQFHPFSRLLSLSDGTKDILRVSSTDDAATLSFSVRRCQTDSHQCMHDAEVNVKNAIVANATSRFLFTVSPEGKMQVFRDGLIIGRLKPDGSYVVAGTPGGLPVPAAEAQLYLGRRTWMQRRKHVQPFEGFIGDLCFWSREVAPVDAASCAATAVR